ncbi:RNA polymerase sigma factor RpoE [Thiomonas bhubaneswarensis]|uniref:RNA polymerase sigma factor n=1 Tax=Thiomonas bhubaneswarensis TaxID=339866 RepID=A0A0K6I347_9BURK|nr:RNA polymerase sigma factor RpoE [Thiomonas bhubaneswarensis]CUA97702.1 RNA polymerase, sigma-24 subunit, RpoE [Thiomonas bhubaneswarensis]
MQQDIPSDAVLVQQVQAGQQKAFDLLVAKYQRRIYRLVLRFIRDPALAEDVAQETFLRAYRAIGQFRGESQFYTWLYRIAVNTAKKAISDDIRDPTVSEGDASGHDEETFSPTELLSNHETPESILVSKEIVQTVNAAMESLPEDLRMAITLREIEGLSYEDIAEAMQCPIGTVRSRIFRAREAIAERLRPVIEHKGGKRW